MKLFQVCFSTMMIPICIQRSMRQPLGWHCSNRAGRERERGRQRVTSQSAKLVLSIFLSSVVHYEFGSDSTVFIIWSVAVLTSFQKMWSNHLLCSTEVQCMAIKGWVRVHMSRYRTVFPFLFQQPKQQQVGGHIISALKSVSPGARPLECVLIPSMHKYSRQQCLLLLGVDAWWSGHIVIVQLRNTQIYNALHLSPPPHGKAKLWLTSSSFQRLMRRRYAPGRPVNLSTKLKVFWCQVEALISFISRVHSGRPDVLLHDGLTFPKRRQCKRLNCWGWQTGKGTSWGWSCSPTLTPSLAVLRWCRKGGATNLMD